MSAFVDLTKWFSNGLAVERLLVNKACIVSIVVMGTEAEGYRVGISTSNGEGAWWADPTFTFDKPMALALAEKLEQLVSTDDQCP
ncbi:MAG: hypothetical protein HYU59_00480 [Magnetospirillum gryphiswaldense]|nr:hypothetical protein [Magnetospirillum gryphiswaldense]